MKNKNPVSKSDKAAKRIEPDLETDKYSPTEQDKIIRMVSEDVAADLEVQREWLEDRKLDLKHLDGAKPSELENLTKKKWHSDRNMGLCAAVSDSYHSTLKATCWTPDTIHFKATEKNDIDNKDNLERFTKVIVSKNHCDVEPEVDDYISNKISQGFAIFRLGWKVWYEWVDKRIPKKTGGHTIKTEKVRFEHGVMENIPNLEDILLPRYGSKLQNLPHMVHVLHKYGYEMTDLGKRNIFMNVNEKWIDIVKANCLAKKKDQTTEKEKAAQLSLADVTDDDLRSLPVDLHAWYGIYKKNGKVEKYRFIVELTTQTFLSGKPLRKVTRSGKYPFVGGAFIKKTGKIVGKSLPRLIMHIVNAFNNIWNQKSDFQYVENCPIGFFKPDENFKSQTYDMEPGILYPTDDPSAINIPNMSRSLAWAESDFKTLFELLEKITGAASYFQTTQRNVSGTATRDKLVAQSSQTRFGKWVVAIQSEVAEAITMLVGFYQDNAPPKLGKRVLGEDGKEIIRNLSIDSLRGNYDAHMSPDVTAGSKQYEKDIYMWGFEALQQSPWFDPRMNPRGSWRLTTDTMKKVGFGSPERYMPPEPKAELGTGQEVKDEWARFMQGESFDPNPTDNVQEHLQGHMIQKEQQGHELDEEYRMNFDMHLFKTQKQYSDLIRQIQKERMADKLAQDIIQRNEAGIPGAREEVEGMREGTPRPAPRAGSMDVATQPRGTGGTI